MCVALSCPASLVALQCVILRCVSKWFHLLLSVVVVVVVVGALF
jgi:hypothetical protein